MRLTKVASWIFLVADGLSQFSFRAFQLAIGWYVLSASGSTHAFVYVISYSWVAAIVTTPVAGIVADRSGKDRFLVVVAVVSFISLGFYLLLKEILGFSLITSVVCSVILVTGNSCRVVMGTALIPEIDRDSSAQHLYAARASLNSIFAIAGPSLSAIAVGLLGSSATLWVFLLLYLLAALGYSFLLRVRSQSAIGGFASKSWFRIPKLTRVGVGKLISGYFAGARSVLIVKPELYCCINGIIVNLVVVSFVSVVLPIYVQKSVSLPAYYLGILESSIGLGALVVSLVFRKLSTDGLTFRILLAANASIAAGLIVFGITSSIVVQTVASFLLGAGMIAGNLANSQFRSRAVPDYFRARFESGLYMLVAGSVPVGSLAFGLLFSEDSHSEYVRFVVSISGMLVLVGSGVILFDKRTREIFAMKQGGEKFIYAALFPRAFPL